METEFRIEEDEDGCITVQTKRKSGRAKKGGRKGERILREVKWFSYFKRGASGRNKNDSMNAEVNKFSK